MAVYAGDRRQVTPVTCERDYFVPLLLSAGSAYINATRHSSADRDIWHFLRLGTIFVAGALVALLTATVALSCSRWAATGCSC